MIRSCIAIARLTAATLSLFSALSGLVIAGDISRREPRFLKDHPHGSRYVREADHGYINYPCATYWTSGRAIDHWTLGEGGTYGSFDVSPSPWSYYFIAPYSYQYRPTNGTGFCGIDCLDCRN